MDAPEQNLFSFRAETPVDVSRLLAVMSDGEPNPHPYLSGLTKITMDNHGELGADVVVEMQMKAGVDLDTVRGWMEQVEDSHVMIETLRQVPLSENSLERVFPKPSSF